MTAFSMDLAFVADALLALVGQDADRPFRTEEAFDQREATLARRRRGDELTVERVAAKIGGPTFASEIAGVLDASHLTQRQRDALNLKLTGRTFDQVGEELGVSKQCAMRHFVRSLAKVGPAVRDAPFLGLSECIHDDTERRGHRRRH